MDASPATPQRHRLASLITLGAAVLVIGALAAYFFALDDGSSAGTGGGQASSSVTGPLDNRRPEIGKPAPDFALVDARDGSAIRRLSDFRGKGVVVNWYASWCNPCRAEIPDFVAALGAFPDDLVILGVDYKESRADALEILEELGARYPALLDSDGLVAARWRVDGGLPVTFFVDRDGVLRGLKIGRVTPAELEGNLAKLGMNSTRPAP